MTVLPSSHASPPCVTPSPQMDGGGHTAAPESEKEVEAEPPTALATVAVMEGDVPAGTHAGGVHTTSLVVESPAGTPRVPTLVVQE